MRRHTLVTALIAAALLGYAHATVLFYNAGPIDATGGGAGQSLGTGLSRSVGATDTMYISFEIEPRSFYNSQTAANTYTALQMYAGNSEGFAVGKSWAPTNYGTFGGEVSDTSINIVEDAKLQIPRRLVYKIQYNGTSKATVTIWKDPIPYLSESAQPTSKTTSLNNVSCWFNDLRVRAGDSTTTYRYSDIIIATTFDEAASRGPMTLPESSVKWTYSATNIYSIPSVANGLIYGVSSDNFVNRVRAISATTGLEVWYSAASLDTSVFGRPVIKQTSLGTRVYVVSDRGTLYAMDAADGANLAASNPAFIQTNNPQDAGNACRTSPLVVDTMNGVWVYFVAMDASTSDAPVWYLFKVKDTGTALTYTIGDCLSLMPFKSMKYVSGSPSIGPDGTTVQIPVNHSAGATMLSVNTATMTAISATDVPYSVDTPTTFSRDGSRFYVGDDGGYVRAFWTSNGNPDTGFGGGAGSVKLPKNALIPGCGLALDYWSSPNIIYTATADGYLYALRADTGAHARTWSSTAPQPFDYAQVYGTPLLLKKTSSDVDGMLLVPTLDWLFAIDTGHGDDSRYAVRYPVGPPFNQYFRGVSATGRGSGDSVIVKTGSGSTFQIRCLALP